MTRSVVVLAGVMVVATASFWTDALADPPAGWDPARFMSVDEVVPGMRGVGRTVFKGTQVEEFAVEILGVLESPTPSGDLVLARLEGHGLESSGVVAGMSGSPVYVDGRLLGAVAFGWSYSLEPIAGITPIAEMLRLGERAGSESASPGVRSALNPEQWTRLWESDGEDALRVLEEVGPRTGTGLSPLRVPVSVSGFAEDAGREAAAFLERRGFLGVPGGAGGTTAPAARSMEPGGAVGVEIVRGDAQMAAIGTVTWTDGSRVLAFGHPMFHMGATQYPMSSARIVAVMPRSSTSFKMGSVLAPVGSIRGDYATGILGTVGTSPRLIPFTLDIAFGAREEHLRFEILDAPSLTPVLAGFLALSGLEARGWSTGASTLRIDAEVDLADGRRALQSTAAAAFAPGGVAAGQIARLVALIQENPFESVGIREIRARVSVADTIEAAFVDAVTIPPRAVRPGDIVPVSVALRDYRGGLTSREIRFAIPGALAAGTYRLTVCDSEEDARAEVRRAPARYAPQSLDQLLALLGEERPSDTLLLRLVAAEPNLVVRGRELSRLPASQRAILESPAASGRTASAEATVLRTQEERVGRVVVGCQSVTVKVETPR